MHVYRSTCPHPSVSISKTSIHYLHLHHLHMQIYIHTYLSYIFDYVHVDICTSVTPASVSLPFPIWSRAVGMLCFPAKDLPFGPVGASDAGFPGVSFPGFFFPPAVIGCWDRLFPSLSSCGCPWILWGPLLPAGLLSLLFIPGCCKFCVQPHPPASCSKSRGGPANRNDTQ